MEPAYTVKEILDIQFRGIDHKLDAISNTLKDQNAHFEKRFLQVEKELGELRDQVQELKTENARYKTIWGIGATVGATIFAFTLNRLF
jgi:uncharacterized protein YdcH (DUF465 family)